MTTFELNDRLATDSFPVGKMGICQIRLVNDSRWPWLLLIPEKNDLVELHDMSLAEQQQIATATNDCARLLKQLSHCQKINSGSLGNVVSQLHIHVVARSEGDSNWPNPVWGFESAKSYAVTERENLIAKIQAELN